MAVNKVNKSRHEGKYFDIFDKRLGILLKEKSDLMASKDAQQKEKMAQLDEKIKAGFASFESHIKSKLKKGRDCVVEKTARTNKLSPYEKQVLLFLIWFELHMNGRATPGVIIDFIRGQNLSTSERLRLLGKLKRGGGLCKNNLVTISNDFIGREPYVLLSGEFMNAVYGALGSLPADAGPDGTNRSTGPGHLFNPEISMDDLVVGDEALGEIKSILFLLKKGKPSLGKRDKKGFVMLFHGPPGTGKTLAAEAISCGLKKRIFEMDCSQIYDQWLGVTEKKISEAFAVAEKEQALLLLNEADSLIYSREQFVNSRNNFVNEVLKHVEKTSLVVVFTTNLVGHIDSAMERRLDLAIEFHLPDESTRAKIIKLHMGYAEKAGFQMAGDMDEYMLAAETEGFSGGNIKNIFETALRKLIVEDESLIGRITLLDAVKLERAKGVFGSKKNSCVKGFLA